MYTEIMTDRGSMIRCVVHDAFGRDVARVVARATRSAAVPLGTKPPAELVVVLSAEPSRIRLTLDAIEAAADRATLPVLTGTRRLLIGPLSRGAKPCRSCFARRNHQHGWGLDSFIRRNRPGTVESPRRAGSAPLIVHTAAALVMKARDDLDAGASVDGRAVLLDFPAQQPRVFTVVPTADCVACRPALDTTPIGAG